MIFAYIKPTSMMATSRQESAVQSLLEDVLAKSDKKRHMVITDPRTGRLRSPVWAKLEKRLKPGDSLVVLSINSLGGTIDDIMAAMVLIEKRRVKLHTVQKPDKRLVEGMRALYNELQDNDKLSKKIQASLKPRPRLSPEHIVEVHKRYDGGKGESVAEIAESMNVTRQAIYYHLDEHNHIEDPNKPKRGRGRPRKTPVAGSPGAVAAKSKANGGTKAEGANTELAAS
ncbi:recombinase family protein [Acidocella facilis]|uniref:recombinase family protein n=1 Tax=Acidocella facilis TaxID=525 RepID=UPI001F2919D1|nr:recombinase family protein [Acidocella facilis]